MGYYTRYELNTQPAVSPTVLLQWLHANGYDYDELPDPDGEPVKWYSHEKHLLKVSRAHLNVLFTLDGVGEEHDDVWRKYFSCGKMYEVRAPKWVPPQFDPAKLRSP